MNCYNCSTELTPETNHVEHIPAKNIFATYPNEYKRDLLTVPACFDCNYMYSKIDQEIRDAVGIMNEDNELQNTMTEKAVRSIMRRRNWKERVLSPDGGKSFDISFDYNTFQSLHIKNFKGLFYSKYGYPISDEYEIQVIQEGDEDSEKLQNVKAFLEGYVHENKDWTTIGHEDVFQYKLKSMVTDDNNMIYDNEEDVEDAEGFVCLMHYHQAIIPFIIACKSKFIDSI